MEKDDEVLVLENKHKGCIWSIFHALSYNYWQKYATKRLPYIMHHQPKYSTGTGKRRTSLLAYDSEDSRIVVNPITRKTSSTKKRSLRSCFKSLKSTESSKKITYKMRVVEKSDSEVNKSKNQGFYNIFNKSGQRHVLKKHEAEKETNADVIEIYRVNKDLFSKVFKFTDGGIGKSFCNLETREARAKLTRSGSYPSPNLSQKFKFSKLDHKQNEIWFHSKADQNYSRRTLSFNESSFEKYAQLLPKSSTGEIKLCSSKSLKLTNECLFKRVRSLSRIDCYDIYQKERSSLYEDLERNDSIVKLEQLYYMAENIIENDTDVLPKISEENKERIELKEAKKEEEINFVEGTNEILPHSVLAVQSDLKEDANSLINFLNSNDFERENSCCGIADESKLHIRSYNDFEFVKDILDQSGFSRNDLLVPWYSVDQPLNPSVFDEVDTCWPHKDDFFCHHQLLFDLTNEVLVQIFDTWFTYYPRALSSNCRVPPMVAKFNILEDVWGKISKVMNLRLGSDQTVEGILGEDIWSDDRWMNLQLESECVAIELEDMFFDQLLDEILCS